VIEEMIVEDEESNIRENVTVTLTGRVPLFLFFFNESELTMVGKSTMRLEPETNETP
jgi:hypothetical protein